MARGWGVSGNYHEYAYGPKFDGKGDLWLTLNIDLGDERLNDEFHWRGWAMKVTPSGKLMPMCAGMRSPSGLGANAAGDMFVTDQQGDWIGTCSLHHLREGVFFGHPRSLKSAGLPESPLQEIAKFDVPSGLAWPEALARVPRLSPPAVWFPYKKAGQSATDVVVDDSDGRFGPFAGQLFIGEFRLAAMHRVFLEKVAGEYQGAVFPFRAGFASGVFRMCFGGDGQMYVGLTNRGWSSVGQASYGLQRLTWTGKTPFEILRMHACPDGFELVFTQPVDAVAAAAIDAYSLSSYTYLLHKPYGSEEVLTRDLSIDSVRVAADRRSVRLKVAGLRDGFVH
ncbi:MAG: hypothetical protein KDA41_03175, partial [Planctomycetales bacterium]|nr:hypothetical protein [Planctomycetales bacterium]